MDAITTSFLLRCDDRAEIRDTFWYEPAYLISPYQRQLEDLFRPEDRERLRQVLKEANDSEGLLACEGRFRMASPAVEVSLDLLAIGDSLLVHGLDASTFGPDCPRASIRALAHRFMDVIRVADGDFIPGNDAMVREQFEQIQKLNNEMMNMQRQLQKANAQLNQLNRDLNNRLVKDALTGLVSRYQYRAEIERAIAEAPGKKGIFAFIDLDDFKSINDTYGHGAGDLFLKGFASRLERLPYPERICMRIAGDEFGIYLHGFDRVGPEEIRALWDHVSHVVMGEPIDIGPVGRDVSCCVGVAVYGQDTDDIYDLIEYADFAMYEAKRAGKKACRAFDAERYAAGKAPLSNE